MKSDAYCHFEGMTWPCPGRRLTRLERICRYGGTLSGGDRMVIASVISTYGRLVQGPTRNRAHVLAMIRQAAEAAKDGGK